MTVLGVETIINMVELSSDDNENVLVVGAPGSGKSVSYVRPNILLEKEKSLLILDPHKEEFTYTYKEKLKQGYTVLEYDLSSKTIFDDFRKDLIAYGSEKLAIYIHNFKGFSTFSTEITQKERGLLVQELFKSLLNDEVWNQSLHIILDDYELYPLPDMAGLLSKAKSHNIGVSIIIHAISDIKRIYDERIALNIIGNCESILYIGGCSKQDAEFLSHLAGETDVSTTYENKIIKPYISAEEILTIKPSNALLMIEGEKPKIIEKLFIGDRSTAEGDMYWEEVTDLLLKVLHIYVAEEKNVVTFSESAWQNTIELLNTLEGTEDLDEIISALDSSNKIKDTWLKHRPKGNVIGLLLKELKAKVASRNM
ncbi:type IV secretory system conjugative DNA transfer family protein [Bacillus cereus]|uniref:type IV secretory system conjugative DNA transfer family protein n=1 Tax=Bacillus cereus TaxID=1396 RepID=UPI000BF33F57|nr:type IV secretory system conjugative DNA transfer family protein [Bacillus cereus]PFA82492.1 hypothetical protein CN393_30970 [Bacillus cereus]